MKSKKTLILVPLLFFLNFCVFSQDLSGVWKGNLSFNKTELPLIFNIVKEDKNYRVALISPKQLKSEIPVSVKMLQNDSILFISKAINATYKAILKGDKMQGIFYQNNQKLPLTMSKSDKEVNDDFIERKQDPVPPYPYTEEEVSFKNATAGDIQFSATLTIPNHISNPPVVILISGSGPQDRNGEVLLHRPFLVMADHLTRKGIAVLRYDDRGTFKSKGKFKGATTYDFASDVEAAIAFLKNNKKYTFDKLGLVGHSEGGLIAPMVASQNNQVDFIVMLAAPGVSGKEILRSQIEKSLQLAGTSKKNIEVSDKVLQIIVSEIYSNKSEVVETLNDKIEGKISEFHNTLSDSLKAIMPVDGMMHTAKAFTSDPWMRTFIKIDPGRYLTTIKVPVLALNGSKDYQVIPEINLPVIETTLEKSGNPDYTVKELEGLNHLFQQSKTGAATEYETNEETFNERALSIISDWILSKTTKKGK